MEEDYDGFDWADHGEIEDEDGEEVIHLTEKGLLVLILIGMVPGLHTDDAGELVEELIEKAVDRADLGLGDMD